MNICTNNQARDLCHLGDFNSTDQAKIRAQYDWMDPDDLEFNYGFFKYRGCFYHLQDFLRLPENDASGDLVGWDGYHGDSYFSGTVIKLADNDCDRVIVGRYFC
jgi:hypothetical protein